MTESALSLDEKSDMNKTNREENNNTTIKITANLNLVLLFSNIDRLKKGWNNIVAANNNRNPKLRSYRYTDVCWTSERLKAPLRYTNLIISKLKKCNNTTIKDPITNDISNE